MGLIEFFKAGGATMWLVLLLGMTASVLAIAAAIVAIGRKRGAVLTLGVLSLCAGLLTSGAGVGGTMWAMRQVYAAVAMVSPEHKAQLLAQGISEAMNNAILGIVLGALPLLAGIGAVVRGLLVPSAKLEA